MYKLFLVMLLLIGLLGCDTDLSFSDVTQRNVQTVTEFQETFIFENVYYCSNAPEKDKICWQYMSDELSEDVKVWLGNWNNDGDLEKILVFRN